MFALIKPDYKFIEACLSDQHVYKSELAIEREFALFAAEEYPEELCKLFKVEAGQARDDTVAAVLSANPHYQALLHLTEKIDALMGDLSLEEKEFVELRYVKQRSWYEVADKFHVSVATVRTRWRAKVLEKAWGYVK